MKIGILGAGNVSQKIAALAIEANNEVMIGQRDISKPHVIHNCEYGSLQDAAAFGDLVLVSIPYLATSVALPPLAEVLSGKIVIDTTNPLNSDWSPYDVAPAHSGAEAIQNLIPKGSVVKCFNTIFADMMVKERVKPYGQALTAFLCGDDEKAKTKVSDFAGSLGFGPLDAGPLSCAHYLEAMAHLNIQLAVGMKGGTSAALMYVRSTS